MEKELEINKEFALSVLKQLYSQGDDYYCGETDTSVWASYTNDYPLQHGDGFKLTINKSDLSFVISDKKQSKYYRNRAEEIIKQLSTK